MELAIYASILLLIISIIFQFIFRSKTTASTEILSKLDALSNNLQRFESNYKDDFRINRDEINRNSKENRDELNNAIKDFRKELLDSLNNITSRNIEVMTNFTQSIEGKINGLVEKSDLNAKENRETLAKSINEFSVLTNNQLDNFRKQMEEKLNLLNEQSHKNALEQREIVTKSIKEFQESFDKNVGEINKLLNEKFEAQEKRQKESALDTQTKLDAIRGDIERKLGQLMELNDKHVKDQKENIVSAIKEFQTSLEKSINSFNELQREKFEELKSKQNDLIDTTDKKLQEIKTNVEEKLEKTLHDRISQSFETVGKQLIEVQKGLGDMQTLAQDVGGLKRVLSNVKMRGGFGEVQLSMLLEQILSPEQYEANVKTKHNSSDLVEFAIKLPGKDENNQQVWLPIDAKFPKEAYEKLQTAYDLGDMEQIEAEQKSLELTIKKMAKDISTKYIDPPNTTDFAILFLPFEGIYAEVVRKAALLEDLQRNYKIIVTGPTTLAAILNSLQMGFRTLAIQKRSSEVWQILGAVKSEFETFGGLMNKAHKNIETGLTQLGDVMGKRTKAIQRKLRSVESLNEADTKAVFPELTEDGTFDEEG